MSEQSEHFRNMSKMIISIEYIDKYINNIINIYISILITVVIRLFRILTVTD